MLVRRWVKFALAPVMLVAAGAFLLGGCHRGCGGGHCGWNASPEKQADYIVKRIGKELKLNPQQAAGLDKIKADFLARRPDFLAVAGGFHEELAAQFRSETVDKAKLNQSLSAREAKLQDLRAFVVDEFAEFHALLDSTQRAQVASLIESRAKQCHR